MDGDRAFPANAHVYKDDPSSQPGDRRRTQSRSLQQEARWLGEVVVPEALDTSGRVTTVRRRKKMAVREPRDFEEALFDGEGVVQAQLWGTDLAEGERAKTPNNPGTHSNPFYSNPLDMVQTRRLKQTCLPNLAL